MTTASGPIEVRRMRTIGFSCVVAALAIAGLRLTAEAKSLAVVSNALEGC
jgi:hypothetical protein